VRCDRLLMIVPTEDPDGAIVGDRIVCAPCAWFAADPEGERRNAATVDEH